MAGWDIVEVNNQLAEGGSDEDFCGGSAVASKGGGWKENRMEGVRVGDAHICPEGLEEFCVEFEGICNWELCGQWGVLAY